MSEDTIESQPPVNGPAINIQDLVNVLQVISTCADRGAFKADELTIVGGLYDRLYAFVQATGVKSQPTDAAPVDEADVATTSTI